MFFWGFLKFFLFKSKFFWCHCILKKNFINYFLSKLLQIHNFIIHLLYLNWRGNVKHSISVNFEFKDKWSIVFHKYVALSRLENLPANKILKPFIFNLFLYFLITFIIVYNAFLGVNRFLFNKTPTIFKISGGLIFEKLKPEKKILKLRLGKKKFLKVLKKKFFKKKGMEIY